MPRPVEDSHGRARTAKSSGVGQRFIHSCHGPITRDIGVCWLMTSLTSTPHAEVPGRRHGRSRPLASNQAQIASMTCEVSPVSGTDHLGSRLGSLRQGGAENLESFVVVSVGEEPGLKARWRQVDPGI